MSMLIILAGVMHRAEPIDVGSRRELFVDYYLVERLALIVQRWRTPTAIGINVNSRRLDNPTQLGASRNCGR